jgi:16S rRNA (guanine966-N2)-methyltransferase
VIAGTAKGTRLAPVPAGTRPVSDRAREGIFSSLGPDVVGAAVLDLYAGTGALGIEALSRDAARAVFVDQSGHAIRTIRENLERTHLAARAETVRAAVEAWLRDARGTAFDVVFADPPYATDSSAISQFLSTVVRRSLLAPDGIIVLSRPKRSSTDVIPVDLRVAKTFSYGEALVHLIREDPRARERSLSGDI